MPFIQELRTNKTTIISVGETVYYTGGPIVRNGRPANGVIVLASRDVFLVGDDPSDHPKYIFRGPQTIEVFLSQPEWDCYQAVYGITRTK